MGKHKQSAMDRLLARQSQETGETIARRIMESVDGAEAYCTDPACRGRIRYLKAVECAALARDAAAGRAPAGEMAPACPAAELAALHEMGPVS